MTQDPHYIFGKLKIIFINDVSQKLFEVNIELFHIKFIMILTCENSKVI